MSNRPLDTDAGADEDVTVRTVDPDGSPSVAVVQAVAELTGRDVTDLDSLERVVDTDALDALFAPRPNGERRTGRFSFEYEGFAVSISFDDAVTVRIHDHE
jgi:hypothetical protein